MAIIIILVILLAIFITTILVYLFWYKPKKDAQLSERIQFANQNAGKLIA